MADSAHDTDPQLLGKAYAAGERFRTLKEAYFKGQAEAALARTQMSEAVADALVARADAMTRLRAVAADAYRRARADQVRRRRRNRISRALDKALSRLRSMGRAAVIWRSGLWTASGSGPAAQWRDFKAMAAYARRGPLAAGQSPTLLDHDWYVANYPDITGAPLSPLVHYLLAGGRENRTPHPLFDATFYMSHSGAEVGATGLTPLEHFVHIGAAQGRDPHPLFSIAHYVAEQPELIGGDVNPLVHYLETGWRLGISPHPLFSPAFYRRQIGRADREVPPLVHYLTIGSQRGLKPHALFDPNWYRGQYPDVVAAGQEPLCHFVVAGAREGRSPSGWFDAGHYVTLRGVEASSEFNPLIDYLEGGAWRIGEGRPGFPSPAYLAATPSLVAEGLTPLEHWASVEADRR